MRLAIAVASVLFASTLVAETQFEAKIDQAFTKNRVLSQLYRWYTFYENDQCKLSNQVDLLTQNIVVQSSLGKSQGIDHYRQRVSKLPKAWENAHHVLNAEVKQGANGELQLEADILYQNLNEQRKLMSKRLHYSASLDGSTHLPRFKNVMISVSGDSNAVPYQDAYATNRVLSLAYYWLSLIESRDPATTGKEFHELMPKKFSMELSGGAKLRGVPAFIKWYEQSKVRIQKSSHDIVLFKVKRTKNPKVFSVIMEFYWRGIDAEGNHLDALSRHRWIVIDEPSHRFARVKRIKVKMLKDFGPVKPNS